VISDEEFNKLLEYEVGEDMQEAIQRLAILIDTSFDRGTEEGLRHALELAEIIDQREVSDSHLSYFHYCFSNAWSNLYQLKTVGQEEDWGWEQPYLEKQIFHLRRASASLPVRPSKEFACSLHTNVANAFDSIGRVVEAIEYWQMALKYEPMFGMALGNLGIGLYWYAYHLYDQGHVDALLKSGHVHLAKAVDCDIHSSAKERFKKKLRQIESYFVKGLDSISIKLDGFDLGSTQEEIKYRKWCLKQRLFLNPLNDIGPYPISGRDILTQPPLVVGLDEGPYYPGFYNQMKQEFASARFLLFEGMHTTEPHYSDTGVHLYNTMDYPCYGLSTEKVRIAFRMAYSILDKVAFFLNHYLSLGVKERRVSFKTIWYKKGDRDRGLREFFANRRNQPLRGLFWLSKDLSEDREGFRDALEPDAQELSTIRNHLEHRYLKLHEDSWLGPDERDNPLFRGMTDSMAKSLYMAAFEKKALKLLTLARSALIYLSLGVYTEERSREEARGDDAVKVPMFLDMYEDQWKH
jgi:tetratricopeptide (TPR) repeat protein